MGSLGLVALCVALFVLFPQYAVLHCLRNKKLKESKKTLWTMAILFTLPLAAILYFFLHSIDRTQLKLAQGTLAGLLFLGTGVTMFDHFQTKSAVVQVEAFLEKTPPSPLGLQSVPWTQIEGALRILLKEMKESPWSDVTGRFERYALVDEFFIRYADAKTPDFTWVLWANSWNRLDNRSHPGTLSESNRLPASLPTTSR